MAGILTFQYHYQKPKNEMETGSMITFTRNAESNKFSLDVLLEYCSHGKPVLSLKITLIPH